MTSRLLPAFVGALALLSPWSSAQTEAPFGLRTKLVVEGLQEPTAVRWAAGYPNLMVVAEKAGRIRVVRDGELLPVDLLDLSAKVKVSGLGGFQNVVFHPRYFANGHLYVHYINLDNHMVVERYTVADPPTFQADPNSALPIIGPLVQPIAIHSGGGMAFDELNRLYVAIGDLRLELPGATCQAQDPTTLVGKLVRVEDDGSIPPSNPFVGDPGTLDEIYAFGLRQPYRIDLDEQTGAIFIGDVGEGSREEINYIPPGTSGQNFGWQVLEAELCTPSIACSSFMCPNPALDAPVFSYDHNGGCAVIAGHRYRGGAIPALFGSMVATDWCFGTTWALDVAMDGSLVSVTEFQDELAPFGGLAIDTVNSWGEDLDGELFLVDQGFGFSMIGEVYQVLPAAPFEVNRDTLSLSAGGTASFRIDAGAEQGGDVFVVLGSLSKGSFAFGDDVIPLAFDAYLNLTLTNPNSGPLPDSFGLLDAEGRAEASFVLPAGSSPSLYGTELQHAALAIDVTNGPVISFVTNAERLRLID